jgi:hypothetical protein
VADPIMAEIVQIIHAVYAPGPYNPETDSIPRLRGTGDEPLPRFNPSKNGFDTNSTPRKIRHGARTVKAYIKDGPCIILFMPFSRCLSGSGDMVEGRKIIAGK